MDRRERPGRKDRTLHAFLPTTGYEGTKIGEISERFPVNSRLRPDWQRRAHLGDDHSDFSCRNLYPGKFLHVVAQPRLPAETRHQKIGLVTGFTLKGNGIVVCQLAQRGALQNQAHFCRPHPADGHQYVENSEQNTKNDPSGSRKARNHGSLSVQSQMIVILLLHLVRVKRTTTQWSSLSTQEVKLFSLSRK